MIFLYILYFFYFLSFIFVFSINYIYYKLSNSFNYYLLYSLFKIININGAPMIKFTQWFLIIFDNIFITDKKKNLIIFDIFNNIYNNCSVHSLQYTKKLFYEDYKSSFNDVMTIDESFSVKSGSIAQVYKCYHKQLKKYVAVKVVHPNIYYQFIWFKKIIDFYIYITNFNIFKKYKLPFDFVTIYNDFYKQTDLNNESRNMTLFKEFYKNNEIIVIPQSIFSSKSILIMDFYDGVLFSELQYSEYFKTNIFTIFKLFNLDMILSKSLFHNDLHIANWMIINDSSHNNNNNNDNNNDNHNDNDNNNNNNNNHNNNNNNNHNDNHNNNNNNNHNDNDNNFVNKNNLDISYVSFDSIKIVILDFGYCNNNYYIEFTKEFIMYSDTGNYSKLLDLVISVIKKENEITLDKNDILQYMYDCYNNSNKNLYTNNDYVNLEYTIDICINNCDNTAEFFNNSKNLHFLDKINFLIYFLKYCITNNIVLNKYLFDLLIYFIIIWKNLSSYSYNIDNKKVLSISNYYAKKYNFNSILDWNNMFYKNNNDLHNIYSNTYLDDISCNNLNDVISI